MTRARALFIAAVVLVAGLVLGLLLALIAPGPNSIGILLLVVFLAGLLIGWLLRHPRGPAHRVPDTFDDVSLATALRVRMIGTPADGSPKLPEAPARVVWVEDGDEVLVHLDSLALRLIDRTVLATLDLETDQTGRAPLAVAFAVAGVDDPAGLVAVTEEVPRGNAVLAARWGPAVQAAIWSSLLGLAADHAGERGEAPRGMSVVGDTFRLQSGRPLATLIGPVEETP